MRSVGPVPGAACLLGVTLVVVGICSLARYRLGFQGDKQMLARRVL